MPRGASPGERRGGRKKGTPNRATAAKQAELDEALSLAFETLDPAEIDRLTPADVLIMSMRCLVKRKLIPQAITIAKEAAPYFNAKIAPRFEGSGESGTLIRVIGGLPDGV
jgi:hypothetical protein